MHEMRLTIVLILIAVAVISGCSPAGTGKSEKDVARRLVIVPKSFEPKHDYIPSLSLAAARRVKKEIDEKGYAAIFADSTARPDTCVLAEAPDRNADMAIYVWVQQVDLPRYPQADVPAVHGGIDFRDEKGKHIGGTYGILETSGKPSTDLFYVADPEDPKAIKAADEFGLGLVGSVGRFNDALGEIFAPEE